MAQFRLVKNSGPHKEGGRVYHAGDIIESSSDLVKKFSGKFRRVSGTVDSDDDVADPKVTETITPYDTAKTKRNLPAPVFAPKEEVVEEVEDDPEQADVDETAADDDDEDELPPVTKDEEEEEETGDEDGPKSRKKAKVKVAAKAKKHRY